MLNNFILITLFVTTLFLISSCNPDKKRANHSKTVPTSFNKQVKLKNSHSLLNIALFDTSRRFNNLSDLCKYKMNVETTFYNYKVKDRNTSKQLTDHTIDSLENHNQEMFLLSLYTHLSNLPKNISNFRLLSDIQYSHTISYEKKIELFNSYPESLQKSAIGKQVLSALNLYNHNKGLDVLSFKPVKILNKDLKPNLFSSLFQNRYNHYLIIFSATWCSPCRYQELILEKELPKIDITKIKIISIYIDKNKTKWLDKYKKGGFLWDTYLAENEFNADLLQVLNITSIPRVFLINASKQIVVESSSVNEALDYVRGSKK